MDLGRLTDRRLSVPYLAAGWTAAVVLALTVVVDRWGPVSPDPRTALLVRLAGGWIALLMAVLVWVIVSEPIRLREKVDEATEKLQESERRYRELYDHAPLAYLTLDTDGTITRANQRFEEVLGYRVDEVEGTPVLDLFAEGPDGQEKAKELLDRFHAGDPVRGEELAMETVDGTRIWVTFTVRSVDTEEQARTGTRTLSMVMDITERKRAEERLEYYAKELERSNEDLQQFAYVISHDLQEPIRMIKSYLGLLERRYGSELDQDAEDFIDYAVDGADRMEALIKSLLAYSRVGTKTEPFLRVDVAEVLEDIRADLSVSIEEANAELRSDDVGTVTADPDQLRQLLQNLIVNALKHNGTGSATVRVAHRTDDGVDRLIVEDDGPGIPKEERDRIFDVFHRLGARPDETGTGMGLAICKRIAERHGGTIQVGESSLGGARFEVLLPQEPAEETTPGGIPHVKARDGG